MAFALKRDDFISAEVYLATERTAAQRSEWNAGVIVSRAGASQEHIDIVDNVIFGIRRRLTDRACRTAAHDLRVKTDSSYVYPDVVVTCGERIFTDTDCLINPLIIIEVLSPSTEKTDRGWKLTTYRSIASVQEIVYIHLDQTLHLESLQISIPVREIYESLI